MAIVNYCCAVSSGTQLSQSGDEINLHPLSESQERILSRYVTVDAVTEPVSVPSRQGHHSMRARLGLDITHPMRPAAGADMEQVIVNVDAALSSDLDERVKGWDFIGAFLLSVVAYLF